MVPILFVSCIAVMSLVFGMSSESQPLVFRLLLIQMTDLIGSWHWNLWTGKTGRKFIGVLMLLNVLTWGSCTNIISYLLLNLSFIKSR